MSTATLPRTETTDTGDDDLHHLYCCDKNVAYCGLDITDHSETDGSNAPLCPLCAYIDDECLPCPVPGCPWGTP